MNGFTGGLYRASEWIMRFSVTNVMWILFNLPIAFIVISMLYAKQVGDLFLLAVPLVICIPFLFFPATAAMFSTVRNWILKRDDVSLVKGYWSFYKQNYKKSFYAGIVFTVLWLIWGVDYYYFSTTNVLLLAVFLIMGVILFVLTINFFSVHAHYEMRLIDLIKKALVLTLGSPMLFFSVLIGSAFILFASIDGSLFLILFCTGSLIAFVSFLAFYRLYFKFALHSNND